MLVDIIDPGFLVFPRGIGTVDGGSGHHTSARGMDDRGTDLGGEVCHFGHHALWSSGVLMSHGPRLGALAEFTEQSHLIKTENGAFSPLRKQRFR